MLHAWTSPEVSRRLRLPDFQTVGTQEGGKGTQEGGKVVSHTHRPPLPPHPQEMLLVLDPSEEIQIVNPLNA